VLLLIPFYSPASVAKKITCPALIIAAKQDSLVPVNDVIKTAKAIKNSQFELLECNHFQPYNDFFEQAVTRHLSFIENTINNHQGG